jgi:hypothetical protein
LSIHSSNYDSLELKHRLVLQLSARLTSSVLSIASDNQVLRVKSADSRFRLVYAEARESPEPIVPKAKRDYRVEYLRRTARGTIRAVSFAAVTIRWHLSSIILPVRLSGMTQCLSAAIVIVGSVTTRRTIHRSKGSKSANSNPSGDLWKASPISSRCWSSGCVNMRRS